MTKRDPIAELAELIKANPSCVAIVDYDCWSLHRAHPRVNPYDGDETSEGLARAERWSKANELASDSTHSGPADGYGSDNCCGGDILQALSRIVGITVESA